MFRTTLISSLVLSFSLTAQAATIPFSDNANHKEIVEADYIVADTQGRENRTERRDERPEDRDDRGDDRQDCRQAEGAGDDKRDCKQDERQDRNSDG